MGVADYVLDGVIGQGQFGVAHKSRNIKDGKQYCIKKINSIAKDDQASTLKEAQLLSTLEHPNIIRYKECYIDPSDGSLCIVTSFCEEGELHRRIRLRAKTNQFYKEDEVMDMFIQIASALMYIHSKKILHRDLKTQNIFIARGGIMVLGDFGIAKVLEKTDQFATTVTGTPYYMAPEICSSQPYTFKSDIWSLGCVLYELCTLKHAFAADSLLSLVYQIVRGDYPPIPSDMFSAGLSNLITVLLARQPNERPSLQQVFQIPYVKKHLARYHAEQKLQVERQTNNVARRRMASAPVGVDQVLSPGQSIDAGMEGLTPRQQMARRKELHNQQRELELQMASMAAGDSRAQVLERKQRMIQSHFQQGMVPTRPGALIEPVREEPIRYPDVDAMFNGGDSVLLGSVVMGANGFNDSLVVGSNVAAANDALHAGLTSADGQRPTSTREAHARPSPPTAAPAGPARPNGAAGPGARPRPGQPGFTKAMADRMGAVQVGAPSSSAKAGPGPPKGHQPVRSSADGAAATGRRTSGKGDDDDDDYESDFEDFNGEEGQAMVNRRMDIIKNVEELERTLTSASKVDRDSIVNVQDQVGNTVKVHKAAQLRERCHSDLGPKFDAVYAYLTKVRAAAKPPAEADVNKELLKLVGGDKGHMQGCFLVDQLVFHESMVGLAKPLLGAGGAKAAVGGAAKPGAKPGAKPAAAAKPGPKPYLTAKPGVKLAPSAKKPVR